MCKNIARKDITARRKRLAKSEAAYAQRGIPHSKRLGRRSICGAVLMPMNMPLLELACSAKAPNPEAQHATTLRGMCWNLAFANATCGLSRMLFACSMNLDSSETQRRIPHGKRYRRYGHASCSPVQIRLLMSRGFMPAARNVLKSFARTSREKISQPVRSALQSLRLHAHNAESRTANDWEEEAFVELC